MRRRWRRSICGFATFSPWGEPKLRVGGCPQPAPVRAGGLRQAARGLQLAPVRAGGLRESQWKCAELGRGAFGERLIQGGAGAGIGFRRRAERAGNLRRSWRAGLGRAAHGTPCNSRETAVSVPCMNASAHLLDHNLLVIQQVSSVVSDKYAIMDGNGNAVGRIVDIPDCFSAAFGTSRFDVLDANGSVVLRMGDQFDFDFDFSHVRIRDMPTYVLALSNGSFLASIVDRTGFVGRKLAICPAAGPPLNVRGKAFDRDFEATFGDGGAVVGTVKREWAGVLKEAMGRDRYTLRIHPQAPWEHRLALLGGTLAIDALRMREWLSSCRLRDSDL